MNAVDALLHHEFGELFRELKQRVDARAIVLTGGSKRVFSAGGDFLDLLRQETELDWVFLSPSALFIPGERTGKFRIGKDQLLAGDHGSSISFADYASVVLLRNEPVDGAPVLPLTPSTRLAVVGRLADTVNLGDGGFCRQLGERAGRGARGRRLRLRDDVAWEPNNREANQRSAPAVERGLFLVPKVIE